jgi:hypothetical protein
MTRDMRITFMTGHPARSSEARTWNVEVRRLPEGLEAGLTENHPALLSTFADRSELLLKRAKTAQKLAFAPKYRTSSKPVARSSDSR